MDIGSIWELKPYIKADRIDKSPYNTLEDNHVRWALQTAYFDYPIRFTLVGVLNKKVILKWEDVPRGIKQESMTKALFLEIMYQVEDAPPILAPMPYIVGKRVQIKRDDWALDYLNKLNCNHWDEDDLKKSSIVSLNWDDDYKFWYYGLPEMGLGHIPTPQLELCFEIVE